MRVWLSILPSFAAALLMGVWRGEDLRAGPDVFLTDAAIVMTSFISLSVLVWRFRRIRMKSVGVALVVLASLAGGHQLGERESRKAFNDCVQRGESVRLALADFSDENGYYPDELESLQMSQLPGSRLLRGRVLGYRTTESGYELFFGDWLVSHYATESTVFSAYK